MTVHGHNHIMMATVETDPAPLTTDAAKEGPLTDPHPTTDLTVAEAPATLEEHISLHIPPL